MERRIALLIVSLSALVAFAGGLASVLMTRSILLSSVDAQLRTLASHTHSSVQELAQEVPPDAIVMWSEGTHTTLQTPRRGEVVSARDRAVLVSTLSRKTGVRALKLPDRDDVRVSVVVSGHHRELVALDTESVEHDVARLAALEALAWGISGVLAAGVGLAIARRMARPIHQVTKMAEKVSSSPVESVADALAQRVDVGASNIAEVDALASSVNGLLSHVENALRQRDSGEEALRKFLADVSHELRTPVAIVRSHSELGMRAVGGAEAQPAVGLAHSLERINRESHRMGRLIEDLLLLARTDGTVSAAWESVDVTFVALEAYSDARVLAPHHHFSLSAPDEPIEIKADSDAVHRIVVNLVTNAHKHTPQGTRIEISVARIGDRTQFRVTDNGPGFPPAVAENPGARFIGRNAADPTSTGLGLAITRSLVAACGGRIAFHSNSRGTQVTVSWSDPTVPIRAEHQPSKLNSTTPR